MKMIDPNVMGEKMEKNKKSRYSENRDFEPSFALEEEDKFREYNNPVHTEEEEVLPGLYQSDIDSWKKQFGDVWVVEIDGQHFVYRALERFEYKEILSVPNTDPLMREEMICEYCVLYPQGYNFAVMANQKAGYPAILSELIMEHSGFTRKIDVRKL